MAVDSRHLNPMIDVIAGFRWAVVAAFAPDSADAIGCVSPSSFSGGRADRFRYSEPKFADTI